MDILIIVITFAICYSIYKFFSKLNPRRKTQNKTFTPKPSTPRKMRWSEDQDTDENQKVQWNYPVKTGINPSADYFSWPDIYQFDFDVVGESNYQEAIKQLAEENAIPPEANSRYKIGIMMAHLIPENDNPYDDKAIRIDIDGRTVGYLSRDNARSFRRRLSRKKISNQITTCMAIFIGGEDLNDITRSYGVKLNIEPFE